MPAGIVGPQQLYFLVDLGLVGPQQLHFLVDLGLVGPQQPHVLVDAGTPALPPLACKVPLVVVA